MLQNSLIDFYFSLFHDFSGYNFSVRVSDFPSVTFILGASLNWSVLLSDRCKPASSSLKRLNLSAFCCLSHFAKLHAANGNSLFKESCKETFCVFVYS